MRKSTIRWSDGGTMVIYEDHYIGAANQTETLAAVPVIGTRRTTADSGLLGLPAAQTTSYAPRLIHAAVYEQRDGSQYAVDLVWIEVLQAATGAGHDAGLEEVYRSPHRRVTQQTSEREVVYVTSDVADAATPDGTQRLEGGAAQANHHFLQAVSVAPNVYGSLEKVTYHYRAARTSNDGTGVLTLYGSGRITRTQGFEDIHVNLVTTDTAVFTEDDYGADGVNRHETSGGVEPTDHMLAQSSLTPHWLLGVHRIDVLYRKAYVAS
jgi:hypothetical protein